MSAVQKIYAVGIGPGSMEDMTFKAVRAIEDSDIIVGYKTYIDLLKEYFPQKEFLSSGMTKEKERVTSVINLALEGKRVVLCCSGDAGVYALTSLLYEICEEKKCFDKVEIVPVCGVTAAVSGGALVGAPLTNDYVSISLSDRLTDINTIKNRLKVAAQSDMTVVLYNPKSNGRKKHLKFACDIFLEYRDKETVCAIASRISRLGESYEVFTLKDLYALASDENDKTIGMQTVVFIGCSDTVNINGKMVTKRGYHKKQNEHE